MERGENMTKRSIGMMILLTFVSLGLYLIYWNIKFQVELKAKTGEGFGALGHILMLLFSFGIYVIYWQFAAGQRLGKAGANDYGVLYLVLSIVGFGWLNPFLMQVEANKISD